MRVILTPDSKFHHNGTTCSWVIAEKWFLMPRPSAILNLRMWFFGVSVACGKICVSMLTFVKFGQVAAEIYGNIMIFKMVAVRYAGFSKFDISSSNRRVRAIMPPHSNFGLNWTIWSRVIANNDFQYGVCPPSWIWEFLHFSRVSVALLKICIWIPDFVKFGRFADWDMELWPFSKWRPSAMLDFRNLTFSSSNLRAHAIMPPNSIFRLNRKICSRVIAKKWFSVWRPSAILNLGISEFFSHFRR